MKFDATPAIVITGMPGTGKSALSRYLAERLKDNWTVIQVSLDDALRVQCAIDKLDFKGAPLYGRRNGFFYLEDEWRPKQMELAAAGVFALADFIRSLNLQVERSPLFLMEFPLTEIERFTVRVSDRTNRWVGGVVLLQTERTIRLLRNDSRVDQHRLPDPVLAYFDDELVYADVARHCEELRDAGWPVIIENTEGEEPGVLNRISAAVLAVLAEMLRKMLARETNSITTTGLWGMNARLYGTLRCQRIFVIWHDRTGLIPYSYELGRLLTPWAYRDALDQIIDEACLKVDECCSLPLHQ